MIEVLKQHFQRQRKCFFCDNYVKGGQFHIVTTEKYGDGTPLCQDCINSLKLCVSCMVYAEKAKDFEYIGFICETCQENGAVSDCEICNGDYLTSEKTIAQDSRGIEYNICLDCVEKETFVCESCNTRFLNEEKDSYRIYCNN